MGVRGLTTYISQNSKLYLKPYKLCDSYIVIDGSSLTCQLYEWLSESDSAFGGDYDEYYKTVLEFFNMLKKCNLKPIVLLDGGYETKKFKALLSRFEARLPILRKFEKGFTRAKFFPLFMRETFIEVLEDLRIFYIQCNLEADMEVAAIAKALECPVLSYDSDFYIFDVLYIPFSTVYKKPVQFDNTNKFYIKCSIYSTSHLLENFSGLNKSHLPILAAVLGNDYIQASLFKKLFGRFPLSNNKNISNAEKRVHAVLNWLEKENSQSPTELVLTHFQNVSSGRVRNALKLSKKNYTNTYVSTVVLNKLRSQIGEINLQEKSSNINLPDEIKQLYSQGRIHKSIIDMINFGLYFSQLQIEDVKQQSAHFPALPIIKNIYILLTPYLRKQDPLKVFLIYKRRFGAVSIKQDPTHFLNHVYLHDILKESKKERLKWLCSIVGIEDDDLKIVSSNYWSIFLMSYIYWIKKLKDSVTAAHIQALILMVIANGIVQKYVGYFRNFSKFMKGKATMIAKVKQESIEVGTSRIFNEMLKSVTEYEKLYLQSILLPYRQTTEKAIKKYSVATVHLFNTFQSCLYHIIQMNALLNFPLPFIKISDFYSGTLLYNFYIILINKPRFGCNLLKETPNLARIYDYLWENFSKFLDVSEIIKPRKKNRKKNKAKETDLEEDVLFEEEDVDLDYMDENNPYALLQNIDT